MPWRSRRSPYRVFVSEIMLQQTGISRVTGHYLRFLSRFPSFRSLAAAPLADVLAAWKGLGYNRRAIALQQSAKLVVEKHGGRLPRTVDALTALPGVGRATAGAVLAYAFDLPIPFIETNVRRVFLHFYFPRTHGVSDKRILPLVERTMDRERPREWFYALMDYGTMLARQGENANRRGSGYTRQAAFEGSRRQLRGRILEIMLALGSATEAGIRAGMARRGYDGSDPRLAAALKDMEAEGFLQKRRERFSLK